MAFGFNSVAQGSLNRILVHTIVAQNPQLTVTASQMGKAMATLAFEGDFTNQIDTATAGVNSPVPYVHGTITLNLLKSQSTAGLWFTQVLLNSVIGPVTIYSDSTTFPQVTVQNCSVTSIAPGPYDGQDAGLQITVRGWVPTNALLWLQGS